VLFSFYCDESYDGNPPGNRKIPKGSPPHEPTTYVVGGWFSQARVWRRVEAQWNQKNKACKVPRFHAAHLNGATWEFDGWSKNRRQRYSRGMLRILKDRKTGLAGVSVGIYADDYRRIISDAGRERMGHPFFVCFKSCLAFIGWGMRNAAPEDQVAVVIDQSPFAMEAIKIFYDLKSDPGFIYASRLATCTLADSSEVAALQTADFLAYETFKAMYDDTGGKPNPRYVLKSMFPHNPFAGYYFEDNLLNRIKADIESSTAKPNGLVIVPPENWEAWNQE
jgi:hypothetical protein